MAEHLFIQGGGSYIIPPSAYPIMNVISDAGVDVMFVYPNYRLKAIGFLAVKEVAQDDESDLNVGLLDQQAVLHWMQKYVASFGRDPERDCLGTECWGSSVIAQVIANGGKTEPKLLRNALASSPFWPRTYAYDTPEAQVLYDQFAELAGCAGVESLHCLKNANVQILREASLTVIQSHTYNTSSYSWDWD